jgi:hypothetical protein
MAPFLDDKVSLRGCNEIDILPDWIMMKPAEPDHVADSTTSKRVGCQKQKPPRRFEA